ncbi:MAG: hypothetical protein ACTSWN_14550 [Promethearchaeota archaeon]
MGIKEGFALNALDVVGNSSVVSFDDRVSDFSNGSGIYLGLVFDAHDVICAC